MGVLLSNEKLIASKKDYHSGTIVPGGVHDAYDLYLTQTESGAYLLIVFMKVQFFFKDGKNSKWTTSEKNSFVQNWTTSIKNAWGNKRVIKVLSNGKSVTLDFRFKTQIGGWMHDHWEITVTKIPKGSFSTSYVTPKPRHTNLDSEDLTPTDKGHSQFQRGAVHEFGHMLGLEDEYQTTSAYSGQYSSVMNRGEMVNPRHDTYYLKWLDEILTKKNIK
jgi:hypothetical protein